MMAIADHILCTFTIDAVLLSHAGRTARCRCKFRYFTTASCGFSATAQYFLLVFVCPLQWVSYQKVTSTRKNHMQWDRISHSLSFSITTVIIIRRRHNLTVIINRTRKDSCNSTRGCLGGAAVWRRTRDRKVAGSTPRPGRYQVN